METAAPHREKSKHKLLGKLENPLAAVPEKTRKALENGKSQHRAAPRWLLWSCARAVKTTVMIAGNYRH